MIWQVDALVIGAGVVGLACARSLAAVGLETVVLESQGQFGQGVSSRNSEVIHAGLYYPEGSLKARLCRQGRDMLYRYCASHNIAHRRVGKWVVATDTQQMEALMDIAARAQANGCDDIALLEGELARRIEPELRCVAALESPSTGIVDSHGLMTALLADFEAEGGSLALQSPVVEGEVTAAGISLRIGDSEDTRIKARYVVNAAGLEAPAVAACVMGFPAEAVPARCYAKGSYFTLSGRSPFQRLIYPVPEVGGLGVHLTLDLQGQAKFGPNVEWVDVPEYSVDWGLRDTFHRAITSYWPGCDRDRLQPGYAGVRPKLGTPNHFAEDFVIQSSHTHGIDGLVNLFGIESPGLTSCLAIAEEVLNRLEIH